MNLNDLLEFLNIERDDIKILFWKISTINIHSIDNYITENFDENFDKILILNVPLIIDIKSFSTEMYEMIYRKRHLYILYDENNKPYFEISKLPFYKAIDPFNYNLIKQYEIMELI